MWQAFRRFKKDECSRTRGMLSGYVDRRLNPEELVRIEEHLRTCQACREELESLQATVTLLHRLPETAPSRSFTLAPVAPMPGRRPLQAMRFVTAGATVMLVLAMAAYWTDMFQQSPLSNQRFGSSTLGIGKAGASEQGKPYWVVPGAQKSVDGSSENVSLVVPDGSDNVYAAVTSLSQANNGVLYAETVHGSDEAPQLAVAGAGEEAAAGGDVQGYTVIYDSDAGQSDFAVNGDAIRGDSFSYGVSASNLNMVPAGSDNSVVYSFNLAEAKREFKATPNHDWLRYIVYGLVGLVVVLAGTTLALWLRRRKRKTIPAG